MTETPKVGQLITDGTRARDAIHVAIIPVTANSVLFPCQQIGLVESGGPDVVVDAGVANPIGIVDSFLAKDVQKGERFYLFLFPGTVTSLRHVWTHPVFEELARKERVKREQQMAQILRTL